MVEKSIDTNNLLYSGKVWWGESLVNQLVSSIWRKKVWRNNRSSNGLLIVSTNLDGFSLVNRGRFAKFAKFFPRQTFPLYGMYRYSWTYKGQTLIVLVKPNQSQNRIFSFEIWHTNTIAINLNCEFNCDCQVQVVLN